MGRGRRPSKAKPKTKAKKLEDDVEESGSAAEDNSIAVAAEPGEGAEELGLGGKAATLTNLVSEPQHCLAGLGGGEQAEQERVKILRGLLKWFFEYSRAADEASGAGDDLLSSPIGPLDELMVDDFDLDSIWAQLQLRNGAWVKQINKAASLLVASSDVSLAADISSSSEGEEEDGPEDDGSELEPEASLDDLESEDPEEFDGELEEEDSRFATIKGDKKKKKKKETVKGTNDSVRDGFFDLSDMNRFADEEEAMNDELSEQELDFIYGGGDVLSDDEGREATFDDFFKRKDYAPRRTDREEDDDGDGEEDEEEEDDDETDEEQENDELNGAREGSDLEEEESEEDGDGNPKSQFARKQQQLKKAIKGMEDELIREKPWALRGEVAAKDRPTNSLLEAALDVERVARVVQPVTAEKSASLEELIKQRILDEKFDDLVPKNVELPHNKKKQSAPEVSQEKSSEGLGDIYAAEYMRRTLGVEKDDPKKPLKEELKVLFSKLCHKLDALCNFHFKPKPVIPEMEVAADLPAISMEEALPVGMSTADALAPEERHAPKRGRAGEFLEPTEMEQDDRKRARLAKKRSRNKSRKRDEAEHKLVSRANPGLGNPYEKRKMLEDIRSSRNVVEGKEVDTGKEFNTSGKFFREMEKTVREGVKKSRVGSQEHEGRKRGGGGAAALKL